MYVMYEKYAVTHKIAKGAPMAKADRPKPDNPQSNKQDKQNKAEKCFYGVATVGERGQIVIPADLRKDLAIQGGDKLMLWTHPSGKGIMLFPIEEMRDFMTMMLANLEHAERALAAPADSMPQAKPKMQPETQSLSQTEAAETTE